MRQQADFRPPWWLRGPHLQSILPSLPWRRPLVERRAQAVMVASRELLLDAGDGVRLQAFHAPAIRDSSHRDQAVVLLHGWEGSANSLYVLSLAQTLYEQGFDVVRLNLRDHGETHHLNRELFHSCRLDEVVGAIGQLQQLLPAHALSLAGFSLGGNFMLRVAASAPRHDLQIAKAIGISPVLDPAVTLDALESGWSLYHWYFVRKWTRSLRLKEKYWPGSFDFKDLLASGDLRRMTRELVLSHSDYQAVEDYFSGYALTGDRLRELIVPSTIVTSLDDPIIPATDLERLAQPAALKIITTPTGGHCGFFEAFAETAWLDRLVLDELKT